MASSEEPVRILGFYFETKPTVKTHIEMTIKKARRRYWVLRHLKLFGFDQKELVQVYSSLVRSVVEYCHVVYHSLLTGEMEADLERVQFQALKCIYGYAGQSYRSLLELSGLETLKDRRLKAMDKFTDKCLEGRFKEWFPLRETCRTIRNNRPYKEQYARCDRLRNSPSTICVGG